MSKETESKNEFTNIEREAIILNASRGMIDDMVNHAIFMPLGENRHEINLLPKTSLALVQFSTLLRDFLSPVTAKGRQPLPFGLPKPPNGDIATDHTALFYLHQIGEKPLIGTEIKPLRSAVQEFAEWLNEPAHVPGVWLSNIGVEIDLTIKRIDFIRISGDIGKHNFLRLAGQVRGIKRVLSENGVEIDDGEAYMALPDVWDWFHTHLLAFHASNIAEFLNNIRYAIREYVMKVANHQLVRIDEFRYDLNKPIGVRDKFASTQYFDLLASTLREPNYPRFSVSQSFKTQF